MPYPVNGPKTQDFGAHPEFAWQLGYGHLGFDQGVNIGTPVYAIAPGTVLWADWSSKMPTTFANQNMFIPGAPGGGITVLLQHDGYRAIYAHLNATHLNAGQKVKHGERIGYSGNTGNSTGPHHHFETYTYPCSNQPRFSRYNPVPQIEHEDRVAAAVAKPAAPLPAKPQERITVSAGAVQRDKATTVGSKIVRTIAGGKTEAFTGYVIGQEVVRDGIPGVQHRVVSNIWYVDHGDTGKGAARYSSAIGYTEQKISGLPNLTPAPAKPKNRRTVVPLGAYMRDAPNSTGKILRGIDGNTTEDFTHYVIGQEITREAKGDIPALKTNIWYKDSEGFVSAVGFRETNLTDGLVKMTLPPAVPVVPEPKPYTFVKDVAAVTAVRPAHRSNFGVGEMPAYGKQTKIVLHQFNGANPKDDPVTNWDTVHIGSVRNAFTQEGGRIASAHFAVEKLDVDQYVSLKDRAYHAGPEGNDFWSIEIYGGMDSVTRATVVQLIKELNALAGRTLELVDHRGLIEGKTLCGSNVDLNWFRNAVSGNIIEPTPEVKPSTPPAPEVPGPDHAAESEKNVLTAFFSWLMDQFLNRKR